MTESVSLKIENEDIVFADLSNREKLEVIIVCKSGNVFLFDHKAQSMVLINQLAFNPYELNLQIHSFQNYICVTQKNGTFGMVINLASPNYEKKLERGDYCAQASLFPIAFYSKENQTFLIHGTEWNRLDITCLETDELLTDRIVDDDTNLNSFDYFHSSLLVSPDSNSFTSNGWIWHPYGQVTSYSINTFLREFELSNTKIRLMDEPYDLDWDRPLCWISNQMLGIGYNKKAASETENNHPSEIIFYDIKECKIKKRIKFDGFSLSSDGDVIGELFFDFEKKHFVGLNKQNGLLVCDLNGKEVLRNSKLAFHKYSPTHKIFYKLDRKQQVIKLTGMT